MHPSAQSRSWTQSEVVRGLLGASVLGVLAFSPRAHADYVLAANCTGTVRLSVFPSLHASFAQDLVEYRWSILLESCQGPADSVEQLQGAVISSQLSLANARCGDAAGPAGWFVNSLTWADGGEAKMTLTNDTLNIFAPTYRPAYYGMVTEGTSPRGSLRGGAYSIVLTFPGLNVSQACSAPNGFAGGEGTAQVKVITQRYPGAP